MRKTLEEKAAHSRALLEKVLDEHGPDRVRVAWTGGKDSTVVLHLWRGLLAERGLGPARAVNLDTGCKFPEVMAFRDRLAGEWGIDLHVARPEVNLAGYPIAVDKVSCCRDLKILPLEKAVAELHVACLVTGIRRDEHPSRAKRQEWESVAPSVDQIISAEGVVSENQDALANRNVSDDHGVIASQPPVTTQSPAANRALAANKPPLEKQSGAGSQEAAAHLRLNPLLDWTEMDVWAWITGREIPFCELYGRGYRSLGCVPCTALPSGGAERSGRDSGKDENLALLTSMGYF